MTLSINSGVMKETNRRLIMECVRERVQLSRKDLAALTGLTPATVTNLVKELLDEGLLLETGRGTSRSGPRPILLELNAGWGYIVGVELTVTDIVSVLTDFRTAVLYRSTLAIDLAEGRDAVLDSLVTAVNAAITTAGVPREKVRGIGIVSAGPFRREAGEMIAPPNFPGWQGTPVKRIVEDRVGIPVWFDKETQAAAFGEFWFGDAADARELFACNIFKVGIGGGLLVDGKAYRGHLENASNIGHTKVLLDGELCTCGEFGCLETVGDGRAAVRWAREAFADEASGFAAFGATSVSDVDFEFVVRAAEEGLAPCRDAVTRCARYVGMALANVIRLVAPDTIVLCGEFPDQSALFVTEVLAATQARHNQTQDDVRIYHSGLGPDGAALGGVAIVFDNLGAASQDS
ncbi:MAG: ROK family protein [Propionicimonas sp.]|uniref:ROK family protein n=1 Tax=Propionicimonas sp. TaxID=1955623 RepID=UPI002B1FD968|nr:ROK family protein [Propionicimonas sp.]MEA4945299.1 ROK family protein [Propionicimonas sp.]MEA5052928.1 ROK family protein [Propionicimonas sp.]